MSSLPTIIEEPPMNSGTTSQPTASPEAPKQPEEKLMPWFERLLPLWVILCMGVGWLLGYLLPGVATALADTAVEEINIPVAILIWAMVYPMMLKIDFSALIQIPRNPKGLIVTSTINFGVQPFMMYGLAMLFFRLAYQHVLSEEKAKLFVAGAVILGAGPCTAMVFVWSSLVNGDPNYTLVQVALNDLLLLAFFAPTVMALLAGSNVAVPYMTVLLSVIFYVAIPFALALVSRFALGRCFGPDWVEKKLLPKLALPSTIALLLTLILVFMFQAQQIVDNPVDLLLILVPLTLQSYFIFGLAIAVCYAARIPFRIAAPAAMIASSNFFELAVAVTISSYGLGSPAVLVTVAGVLEEVPVMLSLVSICKLLKSRFDARASTPAATEEASPNEPAAGVGAGAVVVVVDVQPVETTEGFPSTELPGPSVEA